jgi:hypothetical protein
VGALEPDVAEEILSDVRLALSVRHLHSEPGQGPGQPARNDQAGSCRSG